MQATHTIVKQPVSNMVSSSAVSRAFVKSTCRGDPENSYCMHGLDHACDFGVLIFNCICVIKFCVPI